MPPSSPSRLQSGPHAGLGARVAGRAVIWKAHIRTAVILCLVGMTAYLLSVLMGLPINIWLGRIIGDPSHLSTLSKLIFATLAMDLSKVLVLAVLGFFLARLLVVRPWVAALGITFSCYAFDVALAWVLQDLSGTWTNWPALAGRIPLAIGTGFLVFLLFRHSAGISHHPSERTAKKQTHQAIQPSREGDDRNHDNETSGHAGEDPDHEIGGSKQGLDTPNHDNSQSAHNSKEVIREGEDTAASGPRRPE